MSLNLYTIEFSLSLSSIFSIYNWHDLFPKICGIENLHTGTLDFGITIQKIY